MGQEHFFILLHQIFLPTEVEAFVRAFAKLGHTHADATLALQQALCEVTASNKLKADATAEASCLLTGQYKFHCSLKEIVDKSLWVTWTGKKYSEKFAKAGAALKRMRTERSGKLSSLKNVCSVGGCCRKPVLSRTFESSRPGGQF